MAKVTEMVMETVMVMVVMETVATVVEMAVATVAVAMEGVEENDLL
jgi:hypothetical protein